MFEKYRHNRISKVISNQIFLYCAGKFDDISLLKYLPEQFSKQIFLESGIKDEESQNYIEIITIFWLSTVLFLSRKDKLKYFYYYEYYDSIRYEILRIIQSKFRNNAINEYINFRDENIDMVELISDICNNDEGDIVLDRISHKYFEEILNFSPQSRSFLDRDSVAGKFKLLAKNIIKNSKLRR